MGEKAREFVILVREDPDTKLWSVDTGNEIVRDLTWDAAVEAVRAHMEVVIDLKVEIRG